MIKEKILSIIFLCFCFTFCNKQKVNIQENTNTLFVDLNKRNKVSVFEIFKKIEIIPLETTQKSLIKSVSKIEYYNKKYYILDRENFSLLSFDDEGKYIGNIGKMGQGPEDYYSAYDFLIDKMNNIIIILSPIGQLYLYDLTTKKLIEKIQLKNGPSNYQKFMILTDDIFVFFSNVLEHEKQLFIFSKKQNKFINSFCEENKMLSMFSNEVFYTFANKMFFSKPFDNNVYIIN